MTIQLGTYLRICYLHLHVLNVCTLHVPIDDLRYNIFAFLSIRWLFCVLSQLYPLKYPMVMIRTAPEGAL